MAKKPKGGPKRTADENEAESQRFMDLGRELEAAGELNLTEAAESFDRLSDSILKPIRGGSATNGVREGCENKK